jgi:hypothetical protein
MSHIFVREVTLSGRQFEAFKILRLGGNVATDSPGTRTGGIRDMRRVPACRPVFCGPGKEQVVPLILDIRLRFSKQSL